jgi:hypothetical protein
MPIVKEKLMNLLIKETMNNNDYRVNGDDYEEAQPL